MSIWSVVRHISVVKETLRLEYSYDRKFFTSFLSWAKTSNFSHLRSISNVRISSDTLLDWISFLVGCSTLNHLEMNFYDFKTYLDAMENAQFRQIRVSRLRISCPNSRSWPDEVDLKLDGMPHLSSLLLDYPSNWRKCPSQFPPNLKELALFCPFRALLCIFNIFLINLT